MPPRRHRGNRSAEARSVRARLASGREARVLLHFARFVGKASDLIYKAVYRAAITWVSVLRLGRDSFAVDNGSLAGRFAARVFGDLTGISDLITVL